MLLLVAACAPGPPADLPAPWTGAVPSGEEVSGSFHDDLGDALPGVGWFSWDRGDGRDLTRARVVDVDGAEPVVQVEVLGRGDFEAWSVLTIAVARSRWRAGEVPLDGRDAVLSLAEPGDEQRWALGGTLWVTSAGVAPGETVAGTFEGVALGW